MVNAKRLKSEISVSLKNIIRHSQFVIYQLLITLYNYQNCDCDSENK